MFETVNFDFVQDWAKNTGRDADKIKDMILSEAKRFIVCYYTDEYEAIIKSKRLIYNKLRYELTHNICMPIDHLNLDKDGIYKEFELDLNDTDLNDLHMILIADSQLRFIDIKDYFYPLKGACYDLTDNLNHSGNVIQRWVSDRIDIKTKIDNIRSIHKISVLFFKEDYKNIPDFVKYHCDYKFMDNKLVKLR